MVCPHRFIWFSYHLFFFVLIANLATKKRMQNKRKQVVPFVTPKSKHSTRLNSEHEVSSHDLHSSPPRNNPNQPQGVQIDQKDDEKESHLSLPVLACEQSLVIPGGIKRSFSQKITQYLSSKMNQVLPDSEQNEQLQQFEILQAGGRFSHDHEEMRRSDGIHVDDALDV